MENRHGVGESSGGGEKWADTGSVLKVEFTDLDMGFHTETLRL